MKIGYINGSWDLFHVGHLRIIKRARAMCDRLIVGVNQDEDIIVNKGRPPIINQHSRQEIITAIKFCDECIISPYHTTPEQMIEMGADIKFCGSDYDNDSIVMKLKKDLEPYGKQVVILPRTDGISTTILREVLAG